MCMQAEALELVVAPGNLILGTRNPSLPDPLGSAFGGQVYNAFELVGDRIRTVRDFATRERASEPPASTARAPGDDRHRQRLRRPHRLRRVRAPHNSRRVKRQRRSVRR